MNPLADSPRLRVAFFGAGEFGLPVLRMLARDHRLVAVISQPDRPAGRGKVLTPAPIAEYAAAALSEIPLLKFESVADPAACAAVRAVAGPEHVDAWVIVAFGQKLPPALLDGIWAINLHGSLLPRWRGAGPIQAAVLAGDAETGNTVITIAQRMDAGLMLGQSRRPIDLTHTAGDMADLLSADGPALISAVLARHAAGADAPVTQDELLVTRARKLAKADGVVDFTLSAEDCRRRINGMNPWPGITVKFRALSLKLLRATTALEDVSPAALAAVQAHATTPRPPGQIIAAMTGLIACGRGTVLRLCNVHPAGKRAMPWPDFARGAKLAGCPTDDPEFRLDCTSTTESAPDKVIE
ncbi:methionyl-tRNA formyltransferase [soil metagenome]